MKFVALTLLALAAAGLPSVRPSRAANGLALTPPMGWNSWNHFGCDVSSRLIRETADALVASGMRDAVPVALESAVMRCLAKDPAERWPSAADLLAELDALKSSSGRPAMTAGARRARRRDLVAAGVVALLVAVGWWMVSERSSRALADDLLVVAPFDVYAPALSLWREGLMDILARGLDGAGALRTVPPSVAVRRWTGPADPATAARLARRSGAGLAVFGQLLSGSGDSVRVTAALVDGGSERVLGEVELREHSGNMDRLADSLTVRLLGEIGRYRAVGAVRLTALNATSLPALKAFLQGEQFFRRTQWDSAIGAYERAVALDSTLALAYARLSRAVGWRRDGVDSVSRAYGLRAGTFNRTGFARQPPGGGRVARGAALGIRWRAAVVAR